MARTKNYPNFDEERKLWRQGYKFVVGLDEAGRGPLAGPVVAAGVYVTVNYNAPQPPLKSRGGTGESLVLRDSKKLSPKQREEWYKVLTRHPDIKWGIGIISHRIIDRVNIFQATKLAMKKAVGNLEKRCNRVSHDREIHDSRLKNNRVNFLILDGKFTIKDLLISQKAIIKADEKVFSCTAASIIAKVTRDRIMINLAKKYPKYGFERHKGYGTRYHREQLKKHGPCKIHRESFRPIKSLT